MPGPEGWSAVTSAADFGNVEVLRMITEAGVPVHWADGHGWLALHAAVFQGKYQCRVELLMQIKHCLNRSLQILKFS
jgi:hypothetical protein